MTIHLLERDHGPTQMGHDFPVMYRVRIDPPARCGLVSPIEILPRRNATGLQRVSAVAPAFGAEPADVGHGLAPAGELPIEDAGQAGLVHHVVAAAEVLVDEDYFAGERSLALDPAQAPFE